MQHWHAPRLGFSSLLLILWGIASPARAQITPDNTVSTTVRREADAIVITGGTQAGGNLFHSFAEFSVPRGDRASFRVQPSVENLFSRVTGSGASRIDGAIEVRLPNGSVSPANLFLLNPNGVLFGADASLNVGGSFLATTAARIDFADGTQFSATEPNAAPLLTVSAPIGIQFGQNPGRLVNQSIAPLLDTAGAPVLDGEGNPISGGLQVPAGETLALVGGTVALPGGALTAAAGRIELGSVASPDRVGLVLANSGLSLAYQTVERFGAIRLSQALIDTSGAIGGAVQIQGGQVSLTDAAQIQSLTQGDGTGAAVRLNASDSLQLSSGSALLTTSEGAGTAGDLVVSAPELGLRGGSVILSLSFGAGNGGSVELVSRRLMLRDGARISAIAFDRGRGGNVTIAATDAVEVVGTTTAPDIPDADRSSGIFAQTFGTAAARGGSLTLETESLLLQDGGQINTSTFGAARAGNLTVRASEVDITGVALDANGDPIVAPNRLLYPSGLFSGVDLDEQRTGGTGSGGTLRVTADRLSLTDGAVLQTTTFASGDAGDLIVNADSITVSGTSRNNFYPTNISANSGGIPGTSLGQVRDATGRGGDLSLTARSLTVRDGAVVTVSSANPTAAAEGAGNLRVRAETTLLDRQARLTAETASGDGGNIDLRSRDLLLLRRGSAIATTAGIEQTRGNGGIITINSDFILSALAENNDISANAFLGNGGDVTIATQGILGILEQEANTPQSDITASSERGVSGSIAITAPDVDPSQGLVELPADVIDAANQIAQTCAAPTADRQQSEFVITGRGGLPPSPAEFRSSEAGLADWVMVAPDSAPAAALPAVDAPAVPVLVEAQGWVIGSSGEVVLVAQAPHAASAPLRPAIAARVGQHGAACGETLGD